MTKLQFRVLYREFLFRAIDLELLAPQGDITKLLGQFASLLIFVSVLFSLSALGLDDARTPRAALLIGAWRMEHILIATTMLVVGIFAVLSWDSTFPDRRDVLVLAPLPVRARTLFLAKVAATASALCLTVVALNGLTGLVWPVALAPRSSGLLDIFVSPALFRAFAAYWFTMISAGGFIFGSVLCVQGLAAQLLPRRLFLRVAALLQLAAFSLMISVFFLQPSIATPQALMAPENQGILAWLPSYWFLGLFQQLNGSMHPALTPLARRAWIAIVVTAGGTAVVYALSYFRTLRGIAEEPDIAPGFGGVNWLPRVGNLLETAVAHFSVRTLLRSRQHRVILAFYLGIGFAISILFLKTPAARRLASATAGDPWHQASLPLLASSIVLMAAWVMGTRVVFSMPLDLRANWIFRVTPIRSGLHCLAARRRALYVIAVAPVCAGSAALFLFLWPWWPAAGHVVILGLLAGILAEFCLHGIQKLPFTCSYLPGRSNFHLTFWLCLGLVMSLIALGARLEQIALGDPAAFVKMLLVLGTVMAGAWWRTVALAKSEEGALQFEEAPAPVILALGLHRDGVLPL